MASRIELQAQRDALALNISKIINPTSGPNIPASKKLEAQKKAKPLIRQLAALDKQLAAMPPKKEEAAAAKTKTDAANKLNPLVNLPLNAPFGIGADIINQLKSIPGLDTSNPAVWQLGGLANQSLVWISDEINPTGGRVTGHSASPKTIAKLATTVGLTASFWKDKSLQNKIMSGYASLGQKITQFEAFGVWQGLVESAAKIYAGGQGAKITPLNLFTDQINTARANKALADKPEIPQRQIQPLERSTVNNFVDSIYLSFKGEAATTEEKNKWFEEFNALNTGTVTVTKKVKNDKGILENVSTTTTGFKESAAQAKIEADIKKKNPLEYQRRKAFEFAAEFSKIMSGGM